jgi:hypothetical protein
MQPYPPIVPHPLVALARLVHARIGLEGSQVASVRQILASIFPPNP